MTIWPRLQGRLTSALNRAKGGQGHLDGLSGGCLIGWAASTRPGSGPLRIGMFCGSRHVAQTVANVFRGDLREAGIGDGHHGFAFALTPELLSIVGRAGGVVTLRALDPPGHEIGSLPLVARAGVSAPGVQGGHRPDPLQARPYGALALIAQRRSTPDQVGAKAPLAGHSKLLSPVQTADAGAAPFAYGDYLLHRFGLADRFDPATPEGRHGFLRWYLRHYAGLRNGLRVPMPAAVIDALNAPAGPLGQSLATVLLQGGEATDAFEAMYAWVTRDVQAIHCPDCLVPRRYAETLSDVPEAWQGLEWAPSRFMLRLRADEPALAALDLDDVSGRRQLALSVIALGAVHPDFLRYMPGGLVEAALDDAAGESAFSAFFGQMFAPEEPPLTRNEYAAILLRSGYDLGRARFTSLTAKGDRFEAAALPAVIGQDKMDVQIIGPFTKSSGLGQAARLSGLVLERTGLRINKVNFDLDNPAPDEAVAGLGRHAPARINLIHLNAETVPLAFAYQPDVFSGAHNIGYFFWELDSPAACHRLGMELVDEIWVSSAYGSAIFSGATQKPVTELGMCVGDMPAIDRARSRADLRGRFGFGAGAFVFFLAFDSFSFVRRKNPLGALRAFQDAFADDPDVRLIIKTQNRRKISDPVHRATWAEIDAALAVDRRVVVLDETMEHADLLRLMAGCDAYLSLHRSEGWGFGMIEAMALDVPVVCTGYSGNMAFCSDETAFLVDASLTDVAPGDYIFVRPGQRWAEPDHAHAVAQMRAVRHDASLRHARVKAARRNVEDRYSVDAVARRYATRLNEILEAR